MIRLVLLLSPAACITAGSFIGHTIRMTIDTYNITEPATSGNAARLQSSSSYHVEGVDSGGTERTSRHPDLPAQQRGSHIYRKVVSSTVDDGNHSLQDELDELQILWDENVDARRSCGTGVLMIVALSVWTRFVPHCWHIAPQISEPQIILRGRGTNGESVVIDDFREAYWWLRDNTPHDARVMAWWDYGYQINGLANRTTLADGNTWNHEHIALIGKCLTSPENVSHPILRHIADYVLIWTTRHAGMYSDDVAKSPHMARIGASVYGDRLGCDAKHYFMTRDGTPSDCMRSSLLWRMHSQRIDQDAVPLRHFEEVYTSTNRMVRIYRILDVSRESKEWRAAQGIRCAVRECYPPALTPTLKLRKSFQQIHGF